MNEAERFGFVIQAQSELQQCITQTNKICDQFKKSYSDYSLNIVQISLLVVYTFFMSLFIWAIFNVDMFLKIFSMQDYARDSLFAKIALAGMCLYMVLHMSKKIINILRIAKIDGYIFNVRNIEKYLQTKLDNIRDIATDADKLIFGSANKKLEPEYNVDAEIAKYSDIVKTYSNSDNNWLNVALTIMHWLSGILFVCVFLLISTPFAVEKISIWLNINEYNLIVLVYIAFFLLLYMILQELLAKNIIERLHKKIKRIISIIFIIGFSGIILYFFYASKDSVLINSFKYDNLFDNILRIVIAYIPLVIGVIFSSIMCYINKIETKVINIFYIICFHGILLLCILGLKSFSIDLYGNLLRSIITLCIPLAIAAFCSSIISITGNIKNNTFRFIIIAIGVAYILSIVIINIKNNITKYAIFTEFINSYGGIIAIVRILLIISGIIVALYLIGSKTSGFTITVICAVVFYFISKIISYVVTGLIIFSLAAFIPLLPSLILLFIASRVNSRSLKKLNITLILMLVAICAAGFSIVKSDLNFFSTPPAPAIDDDVKNVTVISDALNLRAEPSLSAEILKVLYKGNVLTVIGDVSGRWTPVEHEGARGWVSSEFIK